MTASQTTAVNEALDSAVNAEGERWPDYGPRRRNPHKRDMVRRLLLRVVSDLPDDLTVSEIREALEE